MEIKSAFKAKSPEECPYIKNGVLNRRHPYYSQVQYQTFAMKSDIAFFVHYVNKKIFVEKIPSDGKMHAEFDALLEKLK